MPNVLEYKIVGDISDLDKSLKQAEKLQAEYTASIEKTSKELADNIVISKNYKAALEQLNDEFKKGAISQKEYEKGLQNLKRDEQETKIATANLRKELANLKRDQKDLGASLQSGANGVNSFGKAGGNATATLTEFSRVIQDAPYGLNAIVGNIQQSVSQFGYLQKSAGGTTNALKALGSSFLGAGGLVFAVSIVTSLLVEYGDELLNVEDKTKGLADATKEGIGEAQAEVSVIKSLIEVLQSETSSREAKLKAYNKLNELQPSILQGLTFEQAQTFNLKKRVDELTDSLIRQAKVKGFQDLLAKKYAEIAETSQKAGAATANLTDYIVAGFRSAAYGLNGFGQLLELEGLKTAGENVDSLTKDVKELENQLKAVVKVDANSPVSKFLDSGSGKKAKTPKAKKTKAPGVTPQLTSLIDQLKAEDLVDVRSIEVATGLVDEFGLKISTFTDQLVDLQSIKVVTGELDEFGNKIERFSTDLKPPQIKIRPIESTEFLDSLEQAQEQAKIFSEAVGGSIGVLAGQMAASLETGNAVLDAFVGSLINSLAQIAQAQLTSLVTEKFINTAKIQTNQAVSTANAVTAASSTAAAAGPAAAFVLPGLVGGAIALMASTFAGIQAMAFAHGGIVPGGSFTGDKIPAMLNSGEAVLNSQQQANTLMAIANGNSNALQGNVRIDTFTLETALRGSDLLLAIKREEKKR